MSETDRLVKDTRRYRWLHKFIAIPVLFFLFLIGITGLLLGWKKQTKLLPETTKSKASIELPWIPMDSLMAVSDRYTEKEFNEVYKIDRIDVRPSKGIAKIIYQTSFRELQIDGRTGEILSVKKRNSDLIEKIHDGSIFSFLLNSDNEIFKLLYTTWVSLSLIILSVSGFFLWLNPKLIRKRKSQAT
ncbi:MAG: PepSY domain-containing protein [Saprospiraceae bacterium]|nr:PepSY domain-containing protein [Saprospiraceae bacterium]